MKLLLALFSAVAVSAKAVDLTADTFDDLVMTSGKNALVKFYAPWCGHCKRMAPDWAKLGKKYKDHERVLIGDVDATIHSALAQEYGVRGYPTLKVFMAGDVEDYSGGRTLKDLKKFVEDNMMEAPCTSAEKDACSAEQLVELEKAEALSPEERKSQLEKINADIKSTQKAHDDLLESLQSQFKASQETTESTIADLKKGKKWLNAASSAAASKDEL